MYCRDRLALSSAAALIMAVLVAAPADSGALESSAGAASFTSAPWKQLPFFGFQPVSTTDATEDIYAQQCAPCHGSNGEGDSAPSLQASLLSAAERTEIIRDGRDAMPAFGPTLTDEEIEAISDFSGEFIGAGIYAEQCAPCHGVDGSGDIGPSLVVGDLLPIEITEIIANGRDAMPVFGTTGISFFVHGRSIQQSSGGRGRLRRAMRSLSRGQSRGRYRPASDRRAP